MVRHTLAAVYILTSRRRSVLYVGVTSDLVTRVAQHAAGTYPGFTRRHGAHHLVCYEWHADIRQAIVREKQLKAGRRAAKVALIEAMNPDWRDLADGLGLV